MSVFLIWDGIPAKSNVRTKLRKYHGSISARLSEPYYFVRLCTFMTFMADDKSEKHEARVRCKIWSHCRDVCTVHILHFFCRIFKPCFSTYRSERQCGLMIHPYNGTRSYSRASHLKIACFMGHSPFGIHSTMHNAWTMRRSGDIKDLVVALPSTLNG